MFFKLGEENKDFISYIHKYIYRDFLWNVINYPRYKCYQQLFLTIRASSGEIQTWNN